MGKRALVLLLAICLLISLAGCASLTFQNTDELLRAPALGQQQGEIQKALSASLGQEIQYKFPKEGTWRSPLVLADLNGDGADEGIALYSMPSSGMGMQEKGTNVYVAILERQNGKWVLTQDVPGEGVDVASLDIVDMLGDGTRQLIVGYSNAVFSGKSLVIYQYKDETLVPVYKPALYTRYALGDFTGRGGTDLVYVPDKTELQLVYLPVAGGEFQPAQPGVPLGGNLESCVAITPSASGDGGRLLVVDGTVPSSGLASQLVYFSEERFFVAGDGSAMVNESFRQNTLLKSRDIDGNGIVEIPLRLGTNEINTIRGDKRLEFVEWKDFISDDKQAKTKQFGLLDSDRGLFVRLPDAWKGNITVKDGVGEGEWMVEDRSTHMILLRLQVMDPNDIPPVGSIHLPGISSAYLTPRGNLTEIERASISVTSLV